MTDEEIAEALEVTPRTVQRDWVKARMLLRRALSTVSDGHSHDSGSAAIGARYCLPDWTELAPLVDAVLDAPPEQRAALIVELSGGDPAARARVERLVAECERDMPLLDRAAAERFAGCCSTTTRRPRFPSVLGGRYRIGRELGRGGMARVYLARDVKHGRDVAIKVIRPDLSASLGHERFLREIEIAARLRHPNIVPLYDSGEVDGSLYFVMPYEEGPSLRERLRRAGGCRSPTR